MPRKRTVDTTTCADYKMTVFKNTKSVCVSMAINMGKDSGGVHYNSENLYAPMMIA
jgi:hypothetical protein